MSLVEWLALAGLCFVGAASPGPSLAVVVEQTMKGGRQQGAITAIAHGLGVGVYALLAAVGLAVIVQQTPWLFEGLRWLGAGFLLFLAYKSFTAPTQIGAEDTHPVSGRKGAVIGFLTAFLNPKLAIFFLAVYTQFITSSTPLLAKLGMAGVSALVDALWYLLIAAMVSHPSVMSRLQNNAGKLQKVFGVLLVLVAVRVVI
ncbi:MAG: LysE family translocator [Cellvibrionaceae bacterium]